MNGKSIFITGTTIIILIFLSILLLDHFVEKKIREGFQKTFNGKYELNFDKIDISIFPVSLTASGITFQSSDSTYIDMGDEQKILPEISVDKIYLSGLSVVKYILHNTVKVEECIISNPKILIVSKSDTSQVVQLLSDTGGNRAQIYIDKFIVRNAELNWHLKATSQFDAEVSSLHIGGKSPVEFSSFDILLANTTYYTPDSLYSISLGNANFVHPQGVAHLDSLKLESRVGKYEIGQLVGYEKDWMFISVKQILLEGIEYDKVLSDSIILTSVSVDGALLDIFRDKSPQTKSNKTKLLPHALLEQIRPVLSVESLKLLNAEIKYSEQLAKADQPGSITFKNLVATGGPISLDKEIPFILDVKAHVMGKGQLEARFEMPLTSEITNNLYTVKATLGEMSLTDFNPMIKPLSAVNIESGQIKQMKFHFTYDDIESNGEMEFLYDDLKVSFLDHGKSGFLSQVDDAIMSWTANTFVIKKSNNSGEDMRVGTIYYERNQNKSLFNYWWKSILSGIKSSTGIKEPK